jgi:hypothetical protein
VLASQPRDKLLDRVSRLVQATRKLLCPEPLKLGVPGFPGFMTLVEDPGRGSFVPSSSTT